MYSCMWNVIITLTSVGFPWLRTLATENCTQRLSLAELWELLFASGECSSYHSSLLQFQTCLTFREVKRKHSTYFSASSTKLSLKKKQWAFFNLRSCIEMRRWHNLTIKAISLHSLETSGVICSNFNRLQGLWGRSTKVIKMLILCKAFWKG